MTGSAEASFMVMIGFGAMVIGKHEVDLAAHQPYAEVLDGRITRK